MPMTCTICRHPDRDAIDAELIQGTPQRTIATRHGVSRSAVARHSFSHVAAVLARAHDADAVAQGDDLRAQLRTLQLRTLRLLDRAEAAGKLTTAVLAIGAARQNLETLAKMLGQLSQEGSVNILINPEWLRVQAVLLEALRPFPSARYAVADALRALEPATTT